MATNLKRICVLCFSPTGGTEKIARYASAVLATKLNLVQEFFDFTKPENRKCQACVRCCPTHAKHFEDIDFLSHVSMLEENFTRRAENTVII